MEGLESFLPQLEEALEKKRAQLDTQKLPQLKEAFHSLQVLFEGLLNMLIKKGLLREDPYKYDQKITEISVPSDDVITESEKTDEVSYRLSAYRNQLDYLNNYYQFSSSFMDLGRLKRISGLLGYITWRSLSDTSKSPTTRAFANYLSKIKMGTDTMATGIVKDSLTQIEKTLRTINSTMAEMVGFHRESFKCQLRAKVLPHVEANAADVAGRRDEVIRSVKRAFSQQFSGEPYYPELVEEILLEDFDPEGNGRREKVLEILTVQEQKKDAAKKQEEVPHKELLMETARILSRAGPDLSQALETVMENKTALSEIRVGLGEKIRRWLAKSSGRKEAEQVYEVEFFEGADPSPRTEKLYFHAFVEAVQKKASLLTALANKAGAAYRRLEAAKEDQLLEFVSKQLGELQLMHRRLDSLNAFLLRDTPRDEGPRLKGIKLQLTAIKNCLVKANQRKHDYVSRKEEEEQMRRLGIK